MATTFQNDVLYEGNNYIEVHIQAYGDTDQAAVQVIDLSALEGPDGGSITGAPAPSRLSLLEISWDIQGFAYVQLLWDADTDDEIVTMSLQGAKSFWPVGGKHDPQSTGFVGDVLVTTQGAVANSSYDIKMLFRKKQ